MRDFAILRTVIMTVVGVAFWCAAWSRHKYHGGHAEGYRIVRVPPWLSWLCGRPLPGNRVELGVMLSQLLILLFTLLWLPLLILFRVNDLLAKFLIVAFFIVPPAVVLAVQFTVAFVDKRRATGHHPRWW